MENNTYHESRPLQRAFKVVTKSARAFFGTVWSGTAYSHQIAAHFSFFTPYFLPSPSCPYTVPSRLVSEQSHCLTCSYPTSNSCYSSHILSQIVDELIVECLNHWAKRLRVYMSKRLLSACLKHNCRFVDAPVCHQSGVPQKGTQERRPMKRCLLPSLLHRLRRLRYSPTGTKPAELGIGESADVML